MLRIVPLSLLFRYRQFLSIPLPGCPYGRGWAKSAHVYPMSNLLSVVDRVSHDHSPHR